jgi:hypothetical protein
VESRAAQRIMMLGPCSPPLKRKEAPCSPIPIP